MAAVRVAQMVIDKNMHVETESAKVELAECFAGVSCYFDPVRGRMTSGDGPASMGVEGTFIEDSHTCITNQTPKQQQN